MNTANPTLKIILIAFVTALTLTLMGFQSWRRFPLLWGVVGIPTALGYAAGERAGERQARRLIARRAAALYDSETLARLWEVLDENN